MHYVVLYPQNGDRIMTIDSVSLLRPMYTNTLIYLHVVVVFKLSTCTIVNHRAMFQRLTSSPRQRIFAQLIAVANRVYIIHGILAIDLGHRGTSRLYILYKLLVLTMFAGLDRNAFLKAKLSMSSSNTLACE